MAALGAIVGVLAVEALKWLFKRARRAAPSTLAGLDNSLAAIENGNCKAAGRGACCISWCGDAQCRSDVGAQE